MIWRSLYLVEETTLPVAHAQDTILDQHLAATLVELAQADYVRAQARDVVHPRDRPMLAGLARQQNFSPTVDGDDGAITKLDAAADGRVELGKDCTITGHVVGRACVQIPHAVPGTTAPLMPEVNLNNVLDEVY